MEMDINNLKLLRTGQRSATTRLLRKSDDLKDNPECDLEELSVAFEAETKDAC